MNNLSNIDFKNLKNGLIVLSSKGNFGEITKLEINQKNEQMVFINWEKRTQSYDNIENMNFVFLLEEINENIKIGDLVINKDFKVGYIKKITVNILNIKSTPKINKNIFESSIKRDPPPRTPSKIIEIFIFESKETVKIYSPSKEMEQYFYI